MANPAPMANPPPKANKVRTRVSDGVTFHAEIGGQVVPITLDQLRALGNILPGRKTGLTKPLRALFDQGLLELGEIPAPTQAQIAELLRWDDGQSLYLNPKARITVSFVGDGHADPINASSLYTSFIAPDLALALTDMAKRLRVAGRAMRRNALTRGVAIPAEQWTQTFEAIYRQCCSSSVLATCIELVADEVTGFRLRLKLPLQQDQCPYHEAAMTVQRSDRPETTAVTLDMPIGALAELGQVLRQLGCGMARSELANLLASSPHGLTLYNVVAVLADGKMLGPGAPERPDWDTILPPQAALGALHLGHAGMLVRGGASAVLFDPWFVPAHPGYQQQPISAGQLPEIGAIFITHEHWDHINPEIVLRYPPQVPIVVPRQDPGSFLYPRYQQFLALLGCDRVVELGHWEDYLLPDGLVVTAIPFRGEGTLEEQAGRNCYLAGRGGKRIFIHVDSSVDSLGVSDLTDGTVQRMVEEGGPIDVVYATRRQELHFGYEVISDLNPICLGADPRRIASVIENCFCPADYIAALARQTGCAMMVLYSEGGNEWFPSETNFLRTGEDENFVGQDYLWDSLEDFAAACPVPLHLSSPLDTVLLNDEGARYIGKPAGD